MITADCSCRLAEFDFSGIESLLTGRCLWTHGFDSAGARQFIRLARLDIHSAVAALKLGKPLDLTQADEVIRPQLAEIKKAYPWERDVAKRTVHANAYGMSIYGMVEKFPEFFPTLKAAEEFQRYYYAIAPDLPKWHQALRKQARDVGYLGGLTAPGQTPAIWDHPYGYKHWFWDVLNYQPCNEFTARKWLKDPARMHRVVQMHGRWFRMVPGGDSNRVVAFYPQSTAAGRLKDVQMRLFHPDSDDYIGDCYFGRTPLLGPIHDSLLLMIPNRCFDRVVEIVARVMQEPSARLPIPIEWGWGGFLPIGVNAKAGRNWAPRVDQAERDKIKLKTGVDVALNLDGMEDLAIPAWVPTAGQDDPVLPRESEGDVEDWQLLARSVA